MNEPETFDHIGVARLKSAADMIREERPQRYENAGKLISFGIPFLDDFFGALERSDVCICGAKSGQGKTQISMLIALANARAGKTVHFYALESAEYEIGQRLKFQELCRLYYQLSEQERPKIVGRLSYLNWFQGRYRGEFDKLEEMAESGEYLEVLDRIKVLRPGALFTQESFKENYIESKNASDLVIVDHLHFFDIEDTNENRGMKNLMMEIRNSVIVGGCPVLLISHLRKGDRKSLSVVPTMDDFHGSSDINKIATKAFMISANNVPIEERPDVRSTFISSHKCRTDGSRQYHIGAVEFDMTRQSYSKEYIYYKTDFNWSQAIPAYPGECPWWATGSSNRFMESTIRSLRDGPPDEPENRPVKKKSKKQWLGEYDS